MGILFGVKKASYRVLFYKAKMKLFGLVFLAVCSQARVTTRNNGAYKPGVNVDAKITVDDYGNTILKEYDSQFYNSDQNSDEWQPEPEDFETTTEGPIDYPEPTAEPEVVEPFLNSKYDANRVWLSKEDGEWTPSQADFDQVQEDVELSISYE